MKVHRKEVYGLIFHSYPLGRMRIYDRIFVSQEYDYLTRDPKYLLFFYGYIVPVNVEAEHRRKCGKSMKNPATCAGLHYSQKETHTVTKSAIH